MSSDLHDEQAAACYYARFDPLSAPTNTDVDGISVAVASVVISVCLRIIVTWSPADIDVGIQASLRQIYPILLSTLLSINRQQLSLLDANFALIASLSPFTAYLAVASICDLFGIKTGLYKRVNYHRLATRAFGALLPLLWLGLSMTITLSGSAFIDSEICEGSIFRDWLLYFSLFFVGNFITPGNLGIFSLPLFGTPFVLLMFRRRREVVAEVRSYWERQSNPWRWFYVPWTFLKCTWCTIDRNHKWYTYFLFFYLDFSWATEVAGLAFIASGKGYVFSYGQVLSVFAAVPPFIFTVKFVYSRRWDLLRFLRRLPRLCLAEVMYLATGVELDPPAPVDHLPSTHSTLPRLQEVPRDSLPEQPQQPHDLTASLPDSLIHPEPRQESGPSERDRSFNHVVTDVPLAVVHDIIPALLRNKTTAESIELICVVHKLSPLARESIVQLVRENLSPIGTQQRRKNANELSLSTASVNVPPTSVTFPAIQRSWSYG